MADRKQLLQTNLDKNNMIGIEIGAFFNPIVPKSEGWNTIIVDFADTDYLINTAQNHSSDDIRNMANQIENVDIVWSGRDLDAACMSYTKRKIDYIVASHVIEHLPDLISFFEQADRMLSDDGVISLAVPDLRLCFDVMKSPTDLSDLLVAYREKRVFHSPETLFKAWAYCCWNKSAGAWSAAQPVYLEITEPVEHSWDKYKTYVKNYGSADMRYTDAHAWFFTPSSFELCILELNALGLIEFIMSSLVIADGSEFIVQMRKGKYKLNQTNLHVKRTELVKRRFKEMHDIWII
jgi:predicted SAM-dependent methyltransferase